MTTNATSGQEPDASNPDHRPTTPADYATFYPFDTASESQNENETTTEANQ